MGSNLVKVKINDKKFSVPRGTTLLEVCRRNGISVPTLCYHPNLSPGNNCGLCVVENVKTGEFIPSCSTEVKNGMVIQTHSDGVVERVRTRLSGILSKHAQDCFSCEANGRCELQRMTYMHGDRDLLDIKPDYRTGHAIDDSSPSIIRDMNKCILCYRCVTACDELQGMSILSVPKGLEGVEVPQTTDGKPLAETNCINCGACTYYCPVGAITGHSNVLDVLSVLEDRKGKTVVFQTAPAVRVAISEEFGMNPGAISTGKLVESIRQLGADYVFDTDFSADLTIMEEGTELLNRLANGGTLPMFTSCCPAWINLVENSYPEFIPNLSTCKSPQAMMGGLIKTYWAKKLGKSPKDIYVVSVMPCTAKKDEAQREQLVSNEDGVPDVDVVLTTRELAKLIKVKGISFASLKDSEYDNPLGESTGAGVIFGNTGGVMEAALRTAYELALGKELPTLNYKPVRGFDGIKEATVDFGGTPLKVAVVHTGGKAHEYLRKLKAGEVDHHFVEFMMCKGGCIGGGGEPKNLDEDYLQKRMDAIYTIDEEKTLRKSHENPSILKLYDDFLGEPNSHVSHEILHTHYKNRKM